MIADRELTKTESKFFNLLGTFINMCIDVACFLQAARYVCISHPTTKDAVLLVSLSVLAAANSIKYAIGNQKPVVNVTVNQP